MKRALQALLISPNERNREKILKGEKKITIREGHRDYVLSKVMLCCPIDPWCVEAEITGVRHCILKEVTAIECSDEGYDSQKKMIKDLQHYYPELTLDSKVTIIRWDNVQGELVNEYLSQ